MRFFKSLIKLVLFVAILSVIGWRYIGGFITPVVQEQEVPAYTMAYVNFVGEYNKVGSAMNKVFLALSGAQIISNTGAGIYYDDPAVVSGAELRSDIGAIIDPNDASKLSNDPDIKIKTLPAGKKMVVEFPMKNAWSTMIGPMRVYPAITKYMSEKGYSHEVMMAELYDTMAKKIYYIVEIAK